MTTKERAYRDRSISRRDKTRMRPVEKQYLGYGKFLSQAQKDKLNALALEAMRLPLSLRPKSSELLKQVQRTMEV